MFNRSTSQARIQTRWDKEDADERQSCNRHSNAEGDWSTESREAEEKRQISRNLDETSEEEVEVIVASKGRRRQRQTIEDEAIHEPVQHVKYNAIISDSIYNRS